MSFCGDAILSRSRVVGSKRKKRGESYSLPALRPSHGRTGKGPERTPEVLRQNFWPTLQIFISPAENSIIDFRPSRRMDNPAADDSSEEQPQQQPEPKHSFLPFQLSAWGNPGETHHPQSHYSQKSLRTARERIGEVAPGSCSFGQPRKSLNKNPPLHSGELVVCPLSHIKSNTLVLSSGTASGRAFIKTRP